MPNGEKKGITVRIDADLHAEVSQYLRDHSMTMKMPSPICPPQRSMAISMPSSSCTVFNPTAIGLPHLARSDSCII